MSNLIRKVTAEEVLDAARTIEANCIQQFGGRMTWTCVSIYLHLFPSNGRYCTQSCGVPAAVGKLVARGVVIKQPGRGKYNLNLSI